MALIGQEPINAITAFRIFDLISIVFTFMLG